jgi:hypothetical protein
MTLDNLTEKQKADYHAKRLKPSYSHMGVLVMNYNFVNMRLKNLPLLSLAMKEGQLKYGFMSFRSREWTEGGLAGTLKCYTEAFTRHMIDAMDERGSGIDQDSGLPHLVKAMACAYIMLDAIVYQGGEGEEVDFYVSHKASDSRTYVYVSRLLDAVWNFDTGGNPETLTNAADAVCQVIKCLDECITSYCYAAVFGPEKREEIEKKLIEKYGKTS